MLLLMIVLHKLEWVKNYKQISNIFISYIVKWNKIKKYLFNKNITLYIYIVNLYFILSL